MAKRRCPGCGALYEGRSCPECYYKPFDAEEVPQPHSWELKASRTKPARQSAFPSAVPKRSPKCYKKTRRRSFGGKTLLVAGVSFVILFLALSVGILFAATRSVMDDMSYITAEPEPMAIPSDGTVIYDAGDVRLTLDWDGGPINGDIPVYLENDSDRDVIACTSGVAVNGIMNDDVFFYAEAGKGSVGMGQFWMDSELLSSGEITQITFRLEIVDDDTYELLNNREQITIGPGGGYEVPEPAGEMLYDSDGICLYYQGISVNSYGDIVLQFYARNDTASLVNLSSTELLINGKQSGQYLWQDLFPETAGVIGMELYSASSLEIEAPQDIETLEFCLTVTLDEKWDEERISDPITLHIDSN